MTTERLKYLRQELANERISYGELAEIDGAAAEAKIEVSPDMMASDILMELEAKYAIK